MGMFLGSLLFGALMGAYQAHQQKKQTEQLAKIQKEGIAHEMLANAGKANPETKQDAIKFDDDAAKKSAWQNNIVAKAQKQGFGGAGDSKFGVA